MAGHCRLLRRRRRILGTLFGGQKTVVYCRADCTEAHCRLLSVSVSVCVFITNWSHLTLNGTDNYCRCTASLMLMSAVRWQRQQRQQLTLTVKFFFKVLQCCCLVEALSVSMFQVQHLFIYPSLSLSTVQSRSTVCLNVCMCHCFKALSHNDRNTMADRADSVHCLMATSRQQLFNRQTSTLWLSWSRGQQQREMEVQQ